MSLNYFQNEKCCRHKLYRKPLHAFYVQKLLSENRAVYKIMGENTVEPEKSQMII